jgi:hypothetical protein
LTLFVAYGDDPSPAHIREYPVGRASRIAPYKLTEARWRFAHSVEGKTILLYGNPSFPTEAMATFLDHAQALVKLFCQLTRIPFINIVKFK